MTDNGAHVGEERHLCTGENICAGCGWCKDCERFVGQPHVAVCACPPGQEHPLCPQCRARRTAWALTEGAHPDQPWWAKALADWEARTQGERPIDPAQWLITVTEEGVRCGACPSVLLPAERGGLHTSTHLLTGVIERHLLECPRGVEYDRRRFGRGSSFGLAPTDVSGSREARDL